jgi:O-antigen/teichoic acid export membrane protein
MTLASPPTPPPRAGLKARLLDAVKWTVVGYGAMQIVKFGGNLVLARLLAPEMFGVMALANVFIVGLGMFSDVGLGVAAIRSPRGDEPRFLNVVWVVQIARGVIITVGGTLLAGALWLAQQSQWLPAGSAYAAPELPPLLAVLALVGIATGLESTRVWWARRHLALAQLMRQDLVVQVITTAFIIAWAWVSPSVWALAMGWLFGACVKTVLTHLTLRGPANRFEWDPSAFREIFDFGKWTLLSSALTFLLANGDRLLLGALLSAPMLGIYSIAFLLINTCQQVVLRVVSFAVLPALSEVVRERPHQLRATLYRVRRPLDMLCAGGAGALAALGPTVVGVLYDDRYTAAGWMLSLLAVTLVLNSLEVFDRCLLALGKPKWLSALNALRAVALYISIPVGYLLAGLPGAVAGIAVAALVNAVTVWVSQARLGLFDARREALLPLYFALGFGAGWALRLGVQAVRP